MRQLVLGDVVKSDAAGEVFGIAVTPGKTRHLFVQVLAGASVEDVDIEASLDGTNWDGVTTTGPADVRALRITDVPGRFVRVVGTGLTSYLIQLY